MEGNELNWVRGNKWGEHDVLGLRCVAAVGMKASGKVQTALSIDGHGRPATAIMRRAPGVCSFHIEQMREGSGGRHSVRELSESGALDRGLDGKTWDLVLPPCLGGHGRQL